MAEASNMHIAVVGAGPGGYAAAFLAADSGGLGVLSKQRKVQYVQGQAAFENSNTLRVSKTDRAEDNLSFDRIILATGSRPSIIPALKLDTPRVMDSTAALDLAEVPKTLLVIGGGYIGLELGTVYAALGCKVSVVDVRPEVKEREKIFDKVLVSVGRKPNSEIPGLEKTHARVGPSGFIQVNKQLQTDDPAIYAIGDVAGEPMLAHKASHEGRTAVEAIAGHKVAFEPNAIPAVVFTDPEISWCGLTETDAQKQNREIKVAKFPWAASGRAMTLDRTEGMTKLILDPQSERVLGVGIVGAGAGELIAEGVLAIEMGALAKDVALTIHPHPTLSETLMEAAEVFYGTSTDIYRPKR